MRVHEEILQCVGFICVHSGEWLYGGTGFFVHVVSEADPNAIYGYFVTAKHCVVNAQKYGDLHIRLNKREGGVGYAKINAPWIFPEDPGVDLAILPWAPPLDRVDVKYIPQAMIATDALIQEHSIGIGDDLVISGLFTRHYGKTRNVPIVRFGNIAAMPNEPLGDSKTGLSYYAYLIEARSIGGLSGSPVFAHIGPSRVVQGKPLNLGQNTVILLGVVRGHWDHEEKGSNVDFVGQELKQVNMGVAVVTPAQELHKILFGDEWVNKRREADLERGLEQERKTAITQDGDFVGNAKDAR